MNSIEQIGKDIVDSCYKIHTYFGPGLLESAYEVCLAYELTRRQYSIEKQKAQPLEYEGLHLEAGYRMDIVVNDSVIIELKAVESILPIHKAQIITYLKLSKKTLGYLINFNVPVIKDGIHRFVVNHPNN